MTERKQLLQPRINEFLTSQQEVERAKVFVYRPLNESYTHILIDSSGLKISRFPTLGGNSRLIFNYVPTYVSPFSPSTFRFGQIRNAEGCRLFLFFITSRLLEAGIWLNFREKKKKAIHFQDLLETFFF